MGVLIAACLLAWAAGAQSEQARLGISPAERDLRRERVRHERAVRRIADKHGATPASPDGEEASALTVPEAFRAGYRGHTPLERVATPVGRHLGNWAARGVYWSRDTGRSALREYRERRKAAGKPDPAPMVTPPAGIPPMPAEPPTVGAGSRVSLAKPTGPAVAADTDKAPTEAATAPTPVPEPRAAEAKATATPVPTATDESADSGGSTVTPQPENGAGRMAAEVTYESVMDESDELSLMCDDDRMVYRRIRERCEREIGRADTLIAQLKSPGVKAWIARCAEQYKVILAQLDELEANTLAQGESVVKAKALLLAGQGLYAGIAADMEAVEDREFYVSDAVDGEDANAESETYETQGAAA